MQWSDLPLNPSKKMLRQFAAAWIVFFGAFAAVQEFAKHHHNAAVVLACLAFTVGPLGLLFPALIRPIFIGWTIAAFPIGWTVSRVVMGLVFYGMFTPISLLFRLMGRDTLDRAYASGETYWKPKPQPADMRSYFRQS
jgi:hypothetical protein